MKKRILAILLTITVTAATLLPNTEVFASEATTAVSTETYTDATTDASAVEQVEVTENLEDSEGDAESQNADMTESAEEMESATEETESATEETESATETDEKTEIDERTQSVTETEGDLEAATEEGVSTEVTEESEEVQELTEEGQNLKEAANPGVASGSCGANLTWSYSNGVLTISGSGDMYDYPVYNVPQSEQCMPWYYYKDSITTLNIASGVTSIGSCAFWGCNKLTSVTTPASVQSIGFAAFADCTSLTSVNISSGIIGESAFIRCTALQSATIGSGVKAIGISAFENCNGMQAVHISDIAAWCAIDFGGYLANPLQMAKHLYLNGSLVTNLSIPSGVTKIGDYAFEYCADLTNVSIPSGVTEIGDYAFYLCSNLKTASLPAGLTTIGASAFDSTGLTNVAIPDSVSYIGSYAFTWTPISTVSINQGIIGSHAFEGCGCIGSVSIGSGVTRIGDNAFNICAGLRTVNYSGSSAQWGAISKGANNGPLTNANIICSGTGSASGSTVDRSGVYVGATVKFGAYEQDNNTGNGSETLAWTVIDVQGDKALVISEKILDFRRYYPNLQTSVTWENSSLRSWLNNEFINTAFTDSQRGNIHTTTLTNGNNPVYGTAGGSNTNDKVFVLSASELNTYMPYEEDRMAACTEYALASGGGDSALRSPVIGTSYWWLRTPGIFDYGAMYVHYTGSARCDGMAVANTIVGVRPAMWVNTSAVEVEVDPVESFVTRLYNVCLERDPDAAGLEDWTNRLNGGQTTGVTAAYGFIFSAEFQNKNLCNTDYVKQLYRAFMGREYDDGGLSYWVSGLESGKTREEVFNGFAQSAEFSNLCAGYGITLGEGIDIPQYGTVPKGSCTVCGETDGVTAFVTRLYNICLDRNPDEAGLKDWTGNLWSHAKSGKDVSFGFIFSEEFTNKGLSDEEFVEYLYRAFFDRTADADGKRDWLNRMHSQRYSREDVFNGFVGSEEFDNLCKKYGITRD